MEWMTPKRALALVAALIVLIGAALVLARRGSDNHRVSVTSGETSTTTTFTTTSTSTASTASSAQSQDSTSSTESINSTTESSTDAPDDSTSTTVPPPPYGPNALLIATDEGDHQTVSAVNPDGTGQTRLLDSAHVADIGWLPGHQQFAWGEPSSTQGVGQLHVVNVDGSGDHVLEQRSPENEPL